MAKNVPYVILIDDSEDDIYCFTRILRKSGVAHSLGIYRQSEAALDALQAAAWLRSQTERPALCFLDIRIPRLDGFALLKWIREHEKLAGMAVAILSSSDEPQDIARAKLLGANAYLKKFPTPEAVKELMGRLLGKSG